MTAPTRSARSITPVVIATINGARERGFAARSIEQSTASPSRPDDCVAEGLALHRFKVRRRIACCPTRARSRIMTHMLKSFLSLLLVCLAVGCTRYEYDITQPADLATHIGKNEVTVPREPFRYRMQVVENHLIMMIDNPTNDSFQLLGEQSSVVDPTGQSHPLRTVVMAPNSFIKLIFPLERPRYYYPSGPTFGIGVGTVVTHEHRHYFVDDPDYFEDPAPRYLDV